MALWRSPRAIAQRRIWAESTFAFAVPAAEHAGLALEPAGQAAGVPGRIGTVARATRQRRVHLVGCEVGHEAVRRPARERAAPGAEELALVDCRPASLQRQRAPVEAEQHWQLRA